jgi:hypothetical protein
VAVSGFSFGKSKTGKLLPRPGKVLQPHRIDLLKNMINQQESSGLLDVFFNFNIDGYDNASTLDQIAEEMRLFEQVSG